MDQLPVDKPAVAGARHVAVGPVPEPSQMAVQLAPTVLLHTSGQRVMVPVRLNGGGVGHVTALHAPVGADHSPVAVSHSAVMVPKKLVTQPTSQVA